MAIAGRWMLLSQINAFAQKMNWNLDIDKRRKTIYRRGRKKKGKFKILSTNCRMQATLQKGSTTRDSDGYLTHQTERTMLICWGTDCSAAWCWPKTLQRFWHDKMKMTTLMTTDGNMESHDFTSWQDNEREIYIYICRYIGQIKMATFLCLFRAQKK